MNTVAGLEDLFVLPVLDDLNVFNSYIYIYIWQFRLEFSGSRQCLVDHKCVCVIPKLGYSVGYNEVNSCVVSVEIVLSYVRVGEDPFSI